MPFAQEQQIKMNHEGTKDTKKSHEENQLGEA